MNSIAPEGQRGKANGYDAIIVGAGFAGLYALHKLRENGLNVLVVDAADGVGGTWYWNRYPGATVDIESLEYSYSFSEDLQQEWEWSQRYATQGELLRYFEHVVDRFDLRRSIRLGTRIASAIYDEVGNSWTLKTEGGEELTCTYCVMATGFLSAPKTPDLPGLETFKGDVYHSAFWPSEGVDFTGRRVGVVGTGSTAVQIIPKVAEQAGRLTVFQRTPTFSVPLRNGPINKEFERYVKDNYREWRRREREDSFGGWISVNYKPVKRVKQSALGVSPEERRALYEDRYQNGGLAMYNIYPDVFASPEANETLAEFLREKIRSRIQDPKKAETLIPYGFPVLAKRMCADTNYFETYNRDNVDLVDVRKNPLTITENGIEVAGELHELDALILATGFDALSGALMRIEIRGRDGALLSDHWKHGARTAFGLMVAGFPNLFSLSGPGSPCPLYQPVLLAEEQVDWLAAWIDYFRLEGVASIEPTAEAEERWVQECTDAVNGTLFPQAASWYVGANVPGKPPIGLAYFGGIANYRAKCSAILPGHFKDFHVTKA